MKKYENFCAALDNLRAVLDYPKPYDNVVLTGLVGLYEICFEQSWKLMKELLSLSGFEESATGSPRMVLKTAFSAGLIQDQNLWLEALQARNNAAHSYNRTVALEIVTQTQTLFYPMFAALKETVCTVWLDLVQ